MPAPGRQPSKKRHHPATGCGGPCLTIRKFPTERFTVDELIEGGTLTRPQPCSCGRASSGRKNLLVSGGTGSGKTTMLNVLSSFIPARDRIVTVEDVQELQLRQDHVVSLETRPANVEGVGEYTIRDLVKNALRMRPDRILVGECRGIEALDMLQAMNTGHSGSMTTLHSNSSEETIKRLEVLVLSAVELPVVAIHRQIASALDIVVQIARLAGGKRVITRSARSPATTTASQRSSSTTSLPAVRWRAAGDGVPADICRGTAGAGDLIWTSSASMR